MWLNCLIKWYDATIDDWIWGRKSNQLNDEVQKSRMYSFIKKELFTLVALNSFISFAQRSCLNWLEFPAFQFWNALTHWKIPLYFQQYKAWGRRFLLSAPIYTFDLVRKSSGCPSAKNAAIIVRFFFHDMFSNFCYFFARTCFTSHWNSPIISGFWPNSRCNLVTLWCRYEALK